MNILRAIYISGWFKSLAEGGNTRK